jgi:hypothetical protein
MHRSWKLWLVIGAVVAAGLAGLWIHDTFHWRWWVCVLLAPVAGLIGLGIVLVDVSQWGKGKRYKWERDPPPPPSS